MIMTNNQEHVADEQAGFRQEYSTADPSPETDSRESTTKG